MMIQRNFDPRAVTEHYAPTLVRLSELCLRYLFSCIVIQSLLSSIDSDLEAFSHNLTDDSFTALAVLPTVFTKYLNQLFLSY